MERRRFVHVLSAGVATAALSRPNRWRWPSEQLRVAVIGPGSRGQADMREFLRVPGVKITALCDVYEPRFAEARRITGDATPAYTDYRKMLDERAKELDAVLVASPPRHHADHVAGALDAGLHVYGEKIMAFDLDGCRRIVQARQKSGRVYMVGHQYRYAAWTQEAIRRARAGEIGEVTHVYAYWHRNSSWRRPVPATPVPGFTKDQLEHLINWRLYRDTSRGLIGELASHQIDITNWIFDAVPQAAVGTGAITFYDDGRETFDNIQVTYEYPRGRRLFFSSLLGNHKLGYQIVVFGTGGTLEITLDDATFFYEPRRRDSAVPTNRPASIDSLAGTAVTGPTLSTQGDRPYRGPGLKVETKDQRSANLIAVTDFVDSVRAGKHPMADDRVAVSSALPVIYGDEATRAGGRVEFSTLINELRTQAAT